MSMVLVRRSLFLGLVTWSEKSSCWPGGRILPMRMPQKAVELLVLLRRDFMALLEREPRIAVKMIAALSQRTRWLSERVAETVLQPLPVRLARRLCALAADGGTDVHVSQEQLGAFVGAARESVNRQLQNWRKEGVLDLQRGRIRLIDLARLTNVAQSK